MTVLDLRGVGLYVLRARPAHRVGQLFVGRVPGHVGPAVVTRLRRAGSDEARQLRWFVFAVAVSLLLLLTGEIAWGTPLPGLLTYPLVPVAAGVAIVRYRLYDIDPVINKTLVGGAMVLLIFVGYLGSSGTGQLTVTITP